MIGLVLALAAAVGGAQPTALRVLMVADELPAMETLAARLRANAGIDSEVVRQDALAADLAPYDAVFVYIHGALHEPTEQALIRYAEGGGKLIALHHSISSGKRANREWFRFLGVSLPEGDVAHGGYKWIEGVSLTIVNAAPGHPVTTRNVRYESAALGRRTLGGTAAGVAAAGFTLADSEVYLNHVLTGPRTLLLGLDYADAATGAEYHQDTAGWLKRASKGWVFYFMPGHTVREFEHPAYARILTNAVLWQPPTR